MIEKLSRASVLWGLLIITIGLTLSFVLVSSVFGFSFIDHLWTPGKVLVALEDMTTTQKIAHAVATATLDVAYPFAYGSLLAGLIFRYFSKLGGLLVWPALLVIPTDLAEGFVQILILFGQIGLVGWKAMLTKLKYGFLLAAVLIALFGMYRAYRASKKKAAA